jgi:hypothetical protein
MKPWYQSKLVWLGVLLTASGAIPVIVGLLEKASIAPADVVLAVGGILAVILRVWFTDSEIAK